MTIYENRPNLNLSGKTYKEPLLLYGCDNPVLDRVYAPLIVVANCQSPIIENCFTWKGTSNGSLIVTVGHPRYRGDYLGDKKENYGDGTNRLGHIGTLNDERLVVNGVCDISGMIDADPRSDKFAQNWWIDGKPVQLGKIDKSDPQTGEFPPGSKAIFSAKMSGRMWTMAVQNFAQSPTIRNCVATNPNGTGISLYGVLDAQIDDCTAFDCLDYGIGIEHGRGRVRRCKGHRNQVSENAPNGYNQFEVVGLDLGIEFEDCIGQIMRVPKSYGKSELVIK